MLWNTFAPTTAFVSWFLYLIIIILNYFASQEHLRLFSGGWVLSKSPVTFEPLATEFKQLPGGFPTRFWDNISNISAQSGYIFESFAFDFIS